MGLESPEFRVIGTRFGLSRCSVSGSYWPARSLAHTFRLGPSVTYFVPRYVPQDTIKYKLKAERCRGYVLAEDYRAPGNGRREAGPRASRYHWQNLIRFLESGASASVMIGSDLFGLVFEPKIITLFKTRSA